ncbi:hypothetical protein HMPREF1985_00198 [Mitsuokella sp. oral taxon 131 str. W9106]|nr:hypothetical protein HMPREF1985_00198 [Mitsuokella sp. oral taxon 131 str. W9106]
MGSMSMPSIDPAFLPCFFDILRGRTCFVRQEEKSKLFLQKVLTGGFA